MTTTAISAQGTKVEIATGSGSAINVTAVTKSNPCRVTLSSVSGLALGAVVQFASLGGMVELNGQKASIQYIETGTNTIVLAGVNSTGYTTYTSGGTATPQTYTQIENVKTFGGFDGEASELDASNMASTGKEYLLGLKDEGMFTMDVDYDGAAVGQTALESARTSASAQTFRMTLPNARTATFTGFVKKFSKTGGVDQIVKASVAVRISGAVTWA